MGDKTSAIYTFVLQILAIWLLVFLFLVVMLVIVGKSPIMILFTAPGILLEVIFVFYFWLIVFPFSSKVKKKKKPKKMSLKNSF